MFVFRSRVRGDVCVISSRSMGWDVDVLVLVVGKGRYQDSDSDRSKEQDVLRSHRGAQTQRQVTARPCLKRGWRA